MPVFEYQCKSCNAKFEHYHKSVNNLEEVLCPKCHSSENKKLLSSFMPSVNNAGSYKGDTCAGGSCGASYGGGCASGMCGLN